MREGQINSLRQAEELFESAKTNPLHLELSKYLIHNMNSIGVAFKKNWLRGADEHDLEYATKYVELRDRYGEILFPGTKVTESRYEEYVGEYRMTYSDDNFIEALDSYDFSTETGSIMLSTITAHFKKRASKENQEYDTPERYEFARTVYDKVRDMKE